MDRRTPSSRGPRWDGTSRTPAGCCPSETKVHPCPHPTSIVNQNVGSVDRLLRTAIGAVLGAGSLAILVGIGSLPSLLSPVLGVLALVMLGTAASGTCGVYSVFGIDTCSMQSKPPQ
ncbi:MAG: DUF2892 domain-containing protein [Halapricum sp.]